MEIWDNLPHLKTVLVTGGPTPENGLDFWEAVEKGSPDFQAIKTRADDPALIIYTSGTTGPPKGALHAHRTLLGHLPGVEFPHNFFPKKDDFFWTPADWAWIGPAEIEDCLMRHPSVAMAAVVGSPDKIRTEIVKAFIVLKPDVKLDPGIDVEIKDFVKVRLAAHEYPREIEFVDELPMTATGKIMRKELKKLEIERKSKA
jgi:acyl-coenzyme A synthetase/AMP-(fatty) acid ligase